MTRRPTDLDAQQFTIEILQSVADELQTKRDGSGMLGMRENIPGLDLAIRYVTQEIAEIKENIADLEALRTAREDDDGQRIPLDEFLTERGEQ